MKKEVVIIIVVVIVAAALSAYWYFVLRGDVAVPVASQGVGLSDESETQSLGVQLLEKAQNPVKGSVPELKSTVNPVEGLYKNPFE